MGKNIIVSEDTIRDLLEAHASLSAWYYELQSALRTANATARTPDDATRSAFVPRLAENFPELAAVARSIRVPRMFVPPPPAVAGAMPNDPATLNIASGPPPAAPPAGGPAPPPFVVPSSVKYEDGGS